MSKKNVFIIGLDPFNQEKLQHLPEAAECQFHAALDITEIRGVASFAMQDLIGRAERTMASFDHVDAVVSYYDFPGTTLLPILAERFGLPGPSLESVLKCEHKYWSRLEQQKVIPAHIPPFRAFDPFDDDAFAQINLMPPFWIKPIKSFRSYLAYRINDEVQLREHLPELRAHIDYISEPFNHLMRAYHMPAEIAEMRERCIAESPLAGHQCTIEGYVFQGEVVVYGIVDSVREGDRSSFARYEYPSSLPQEIQFRMADVTRRAITQIGLDNSPFNVEFFYNPTDNQVYLLEINPRISQAHGDMFEKVHGISHHEIMLNLALGRRPKPLEVKGPFRLAANCMLRTYDSGRVRRTPTETELREISDRFPGTIIKAHVHEGQHLKELQGQDSYSFELANIFLGGRDQAEILDKYHRIVEALPFEIERDPDTVLH